jgi:hypothetical protein
MWKGHVGALCAYGVTICREWKRRGFNDGCLVQFLRRLEEFPDQSPPEWWGQHEVHEAHRRYLVARLPEHYGPIWPGVEPWPEGVNQVWP